MAFPASDTRPPHAREVEVLPDDQKGDDSVALVRAVVHVVEHERVCKLACRAFDNDRANSAFATENL